jgi:Mn-dependent DtxR family transcriptional regulator
VHKTLLIVDRRTSVSFTEHSVNIKFPTTRRLAEFLEVPHYYILPYLGMMEKEEIVTRAERVGISTTIKGSKILIKLMDKKYKKESESLLGEPLFSKK